MQDFKKVVTKLRPDLSVALAAGFHLKHNRAAQSEVVSRLLYVWINLNTGRLLPALGLIPQLNWNWTMGCPVTMGSDEQTAWAPVIESAVTAPAVTASDELLWGHE